MRSRDYPNTTSHRGAVVHATDSSGYPLCGKYMHGSWYTAEPVNCPHC